MGEKNLQPAVVNAIHQQSSTDPLHRHPLISFHRVKYRTIQMSR